MFMMIKKLLVIFCFTFGFTLRSSDPLKLVSLEADPLAICNDGSPAVYYRPPLNTSGDTKKLLIYLKGGGFCVPFVPGEYSSQNIKNSSYQFQGLDCKSRCEENRPLCTASTDSFFELDWGDPTPLLHSVFSDDPDENPAFHDFNIGNIKIDGFCCIPLIF